MFQNESVQDLSYEYEFDLYEAESVGETHFRNGYARKLFLTQRQKDNSKMACWGFCWLSSIFHGLNLIDKKLAAASTGSDIPLVKERGLLSRTAVGNRVYLRGSKN